MTKVFQVKPKRIKRTNGTVLTPDMVVTVTTQQHTITPFYNGAKELQESYIRRFPSTLPATPSMACLHPTFPRRSWRPFARNSALHTTVTMLT